MIENELIKFDFLDKYSETFNKEENIRKILSLLSSESNFNDMEWVLDLRVKTNNTVKNKYTVYFKNIPLVYQKTVKLFVLILSENSVSTAVDFPSKISHLFSFCKKNNLTLANFKLKHFILYEAYINTLKNERTGEIYHYDTRYRIWLLSKNFLSTFNCYKELPYIKSLKYRSHYLKKYNRADDNRKPISQESLYLLDKYFSDETISLHHRLAYWIIRMYPFRINEVLNIKLDCLKVVNEDFIMISIPNMKNNGGYSVPIFEKELLYIKEEKQKQLIKLIKLKQEESKNLNSLIDNPKMKDMLFVYLGHDKKIHFLTSFYFNKYLKKVLLNIGIEESIVLHQFRTTGTTLRSEFGFTSVQLKELLNVNLETISTYSKPRKENLVKLQKEILEENDNTRMYFRGKIINKSNSFMEKKILESPLSHKLPDMGYCSYENQCGKHYECLDCDYLIPDYDLKEYYRETAMNQLRKADYWENKGNNLYYRDSIHRATLFTKLHEKVLKHEKEINVE